MLGFTDPIRFFSVVRNSPGELASAINDFIRDTLDETTPAWNAEITIVDKGTAFARCELVEPADVKDRLKVMLKDGLTDIPSAEKIYPKLVKEIVEEAGKGKILQFPRQESVPPSPDDEHEWQFATEQETLGKPDPA